MNQSYPSFQIGQQKQAPQPQDDQVIDLNAILGTIWRGKWIIAIFVAVFCVIGAWYAYRVATPIYRSTAVVILDKQQSQVVDLGSVMSGLGSDGTSLRSEVEVMRSRQLMGDVVDKLNLIEDPEFNGSLRELPLKVRMRLSVSNWFSGLFGGGTPTGGSTTLSPGQIEARTAAREQRIRDNVISALIGKVMIRNIAQTFVFEITASTENPQKAVLIADTVAQTYIESQLEAKFQATEQATNWLSTRLAELQGELEEAEARVQDFNANTALVSPETLLALERQLKELRVRIDDAEADLALRRDRLNGLQAAETPTARAQVASDSQLTALLARVGNPEGLEAFNARYEELLSRNQVEVTRAETQLEALYGSRSQLEDQTERQNADLITLQQLNREAEANRLLYEYFLTRLKETSAQQGVQQADSRILSNAVFRGSPAEPNTSLIIAMAGFLGVLVGSLLVVIREARQNTFRTAREMETETAHTVMGQIPLVPSRFRRDVISYLAERPTSAMAEAVRNLRTSVMLSNVDHTPQVIAVTSATPGEGKTTMSMALTQNFTGLGKRVLLIEGDIRRRVFSQYTKTGQKRGLVAVMQKEVSLAEAVIQEDTIKGADLLISEKTSTNAADLFSSDAFARVIAEAREHYDTIIIDTAPVLVVPDARVIAQHTDMLLFVVAWDRTTRPQVNEAIHMFESVNQKVGGLVLNQISPKGMKRYGYGGKYGAYSAYSSYGAKYYQN